MNVPRHICFAVRPLPTPAYLLKSIHCLKHLYAFCLVISQKPGIPQPFPSSSPTHSIKPHEKPKLGIP